MRHTNILTRGNKDLVPNSSVNLVVTALHALDDMNIDYVIWKNGHEIAEALDGSRDIDVFIPRRYKSNVIVTLRGLGWVRLVERSITFPMVEHFYNADERGKLYHLNIYFQVVTGESWLKEYILPLDDFLIENKQQDGSGIWVLNHSAQAYVFYLRHLLKNASILSRLVYRREFSSYENEWARCFDNEQGVTGPNGALTNALLKQAGLSEEGLKQPGWRTSVKARWAFYPCLRFPVCGVILVRYWFLLRKIIFRKLQRRKKEAMTGSIIFALSGADGSGKSTMLEHLKKTYSQFMTIKVVHLGKPQGIIMETARNVLSKKQSPEMAANQPLKGQSKPSMKLALTSFILAFLRLRKAKKAQNWAKKGYLVLSDRWPTRQPGLMDGPKKTPEGDLPRVQRALWAATERVYALMPHADVCVVLDVDVQRAMQRNRSRIKKDKETDDEIVAVHEANREHAALCEQVLRFDNNDDFSSASARLTTLLWRCLAERVA